MDGGAGAGTIGLSAVIKMRVIVATNPHKW